MKAISASKQGFFIAGENIVILMSEVLLCRKKKSKMK